MGSEGEFHSREGPSLARKSYSGSIPILVEAKFHPHENETSRQVNDYFLEHWPFPNEKARYKFVKAGFPRVTCAYFPLALNDRIQYACCLLTLLFLVDGEQSLTLHISCRMVHVTDVNMTGSMQIC